MRGRAWMAAMVTAAGLFASVISPQIARSATAAALRCAATQSTGSSPGAPSPGQPCWVDTPYPFGSDGNAVGDPVANPLCRGSAPGPQWYGDFAEGGVNGNPPCYLRVTSMAFRAWNRGLAATRFVGDLYSPSANALGVWLYNGKRWYPDPTFPGASQCPGNTVLWAGKLDYWLIGGASASAPQTLCRFDGTSLVWEALKLPAASAAHLPADPYGGIRGGVTAGACVAWNSCLFFGSDGIVVHWDGQNLTDVSLAPGPSPWLEPDFTAATADTDAFGRPFEVAVARASRSDPSAPRGLPLPSAPDGSPPPQIFASTGDVLSSLPFSPPAVATPADPYTTDLVAVGGDPVGGVWAAAQPAAREQDSVARPAPLLRLTSAGDPVPCAGYGPDTFTSTYHRQSGGANFSWDTLSVFAGDGSALAGGTYSDTSGSEPVIVAAACGAPPSLTRFRIPDPLSANQAAAPSVPADPNAAALAVAANASNDAWLATDEGRISVEGPGGNIDEYTRPHFYRWTDGLPPRAQPGNDVESRPSLFTIDPPVYAPAPPAVVIVPGPSTTSRKTGATKRKKLPPAVYGVKDALHTAHGRYVLVFTFNVRRKVKLGIQALRGTTVVAASGLHTFTGHRGQLSVALDRRRWPTRFRFVPLPKGKR